ncbi:MAG: hypothetical protein ACHP84_08355 [Caulobacterales bacterium]
MTRVKIPKKRRVLRRRPVLSQVKAAAAARTSRVATSASRVMFS